MPGVNERVRRANQEADKIRADAAGRQGAMVDNAEGIKAGREAENASRAAARRSATVAAEQAVEGNRETTGRRKAAREEAGALEQEIAQVSDMDALHELAAQFHALAASGNLTQEQIDKMREALGQAQERIEGQASDQATASRDAAKAGADAAGKDVQKSKAETVGTFSAMAADRMGFGSTLQERIAKAAEETAGNTRGMRQATVAA
jgi:single-stranded DNA-specific DHH superfamily exonuclease